MTIQNTFKSAGTRMVPAAKLITIGFAMLGAVVLQADTVFSDGTFNLSNYSISTYQTGGGTISVSQATTAGTPAPAMQVITTVPATAGNFLGLGYFLNPTFTYSPASQGTINTINFSEDINFSVSGFLVHLAGEGSSSLASQGGNLYIDRFTAPLKPDSWETTGGTILQSDYDLITNKMTLALDLTQHPNFGGGPIEFGFISAWDSPNVNSNISTEVFDNLSITVNPTSTMTPEPSLLAFFGFGLLASSRLIKYCRSQKSKVTHQLGMRLH